VSLGASAGDARRAADGERARAAERDSQFAPWAGASVGEPVLVSTLSGEPSYWTVPVAREGRVIGFVRVSGTAQVMAAGAFYRDPLHLSGCPAVVTGITAQEALRLAATAAEVNEDAVDAPSYVHDGPPGREAWLVRVRTSGQHKDLLVTAAGAVDRPAGSG
jgi:hypothetical protein